MTLKNRNKVEESQTLAEIPDIVCWFYSVMVSTPDSESGDPSSNIGRTWFYFYGTLNDFESYTNSKLDCTEQLVNYF